MSSARTRRIRLLSRQIFAGDYHDRTVTVGGELRTADVADRGGLVPLVLFTVFLPGPGRRPPRSYRPGGHALGMADLLVVAGIVVFVVAI